MDYNGPPGPRSKRIELGQLYDPCKRYIDILSVTKIRQLAEVGLEACVRGQSAYVKYIWARHRHSTFVSSTDFAHEAESSCGPVLNYASIR